jgi:hypothetical protein
VAQSSSPPDRSAARSAPTVDSSAKKTTQVPLQEGLTTTHIAQGLAQRQASSSSSAVQGTNSQTPTSGATTNQTKPDDKN